MVRVRRFMNDLRRRLESETHGGCSNVWVMLDPNPCDASGGQLPGRRVVCRFEFPFGPHSRENLADPHPLQFGGVECRAWRAWLAFLVARDNAVCAAFACADDHGIAAGAMTAPYTRWMSRIIFTANYLVMGYSSSPRAACLHGPRVSTGRVSPRAACLHGPRVY